MTTISVPLSSDQQRRLDAMVDRGVGANRADVMRRALARLAEEEAVRAVLDTDREPTLRGDLRKLMKKIG